MKRIFTAENGLTSSSVRLIRWRIESIWSQVELSLDFVFARVIFSEEDTSIYFKGRILFCVYCVCALQVCCIKNNGITNTRFRIVITLFRVSQVALVKNLCGFDPWVGKTPLRRKQKPTPIFFLHGEFQGQRSLVGYSPQGCKGLDITEASQHTCTHKMLMRISNSGIA